MVIGGGGGTITYVLTSKEQLHKDNDRAWNEVLSIHHDELRNHETLQQLFKRIAKNYERLHEIGEYKHNLDTVASTMVKQLAKFGLYHYRTNLFKAFDHPDYKKFKRSYNREYYELENVEGFDNAFREESDLVIDEVKQAYETIRKANYRILSRKQHQEIFDLADKNKLFAHNQCESRNIPVTDEMDGNDLAKLDDMNPFREVTHLKKPERREGALYEEWLKLSEDCKDMAEKVAQFVGAISLDEEHKFAKGVHAIRMFIRPWLDDKWRRDYGLWADIFIRRKHTTKHGAQSQSALEGHEILGYNEVGKPIRAKRGVTCEQIDNKAEEAASAFKFMYEHIPFFYECVALFRMAKAPFLVDFTKKLSPKLSHSS